MLGGVEGWRVGFGVEVEVGDGAPFIDLAKPVDGARAKQHCRNQLRLAASTVTDRGNIADGGGVVDLHKGYPPARRGEARAKPVRCSLRGS